MSPLRHALADYLQIRRALGYKLERAEKLLGQYLDHLEDLGADTVTVNNAVGWATRPPAGKNGHWWAFRLSAVRGFANYLHARDDRHEVPPADVLPNRVHRATPYLYGEPQILALMDATVHLRGRLRQQTYRTLIGLLWVTGMRVGEAIGLDRRDVDLVHGVLTVRGAKLGKSRELPLHPTSVQALRRYLRLRDQLCPQPVGDAALIAPTGTRLIYCNVHSTFRELRRRAGLVARPGARCPRIHDIRHTFAVATLIGWYRSGLEVRSWLPLLSTYLGHVHPKDTYWYLHAAPELLALAANRLDQQERQS
ncbi:MAG: tyrosine-type recombinase/integrase [Solirubrobacteraceae bacterium]